MKHSHVIKQKEVFGDELTRSAELTWAKEMNKFIRNARSDRSRLCKDIFSARWKKTWKRVKNEDRSKKSAEVDETALGQLLGYGGAGRDVLPNFCI